ncbi:MAG TPA: cation transporter [Alphaproteobacteria bacterium]
MSACCDHGCAPTQAADRGYRRILWVALAINAAMFAIEIVAGFTASSAALKADALDFLADAANYAISLFAIGMAGYWTSRAALLKGASMGAFGLYVLGDTALKLATGSVPEPVTMGAVGVLALAANGSVAALLFSHRGIDANRRSVWLCARNDAIGNVAVLLAASGVFVSGTGWPDFLVAAIMAGLALSSARLIIRQALGELRRPLPAAAAD